MRKSPLPLFAKEGIVPPFEKGRLGGILQSNAVIIPRLSINENSINERINNGSLQL
jgi:hypothetical protein